MYYTIKHKSTGFTQVLSEEAFRKGLYRNFEVIAQSETNPTETQAAIPEKVLKAMKEADKANKD